MEKIRSEIAGGWLKVSKIYTFVILIQESALYSPKVCQSWILLIK
jgi:hypothetical protein